MLSNKSKDEMSKKDKDAKGEPDASETANKAPDATEEVVPAWAQALVAEVASLKAELETSREVTSGMGEVIAEQELKLQSYGNGQVPVANSQPMLGLPPSVSETPNGNVRTDR